MNFRALRHSEFRDGRNKSLEGYEIPLCAECGEEKMGVLGWFILEGNFSESAILPGVRNLNHKAHYRKSEELEQLSNDLFLCA